MPSTSIVHASDAPNRPVDVTRMLPSLSACRNESAIIIVVPPMPSGNTSQRAPSPIAMSSATMTSNAHPSASTTRSRSPATTVVSKNAGLPSGGNAARSNVCDGTPGQRPTAVPES